MYNAYIFPHLIYADAVWDTCTEDQSRGLGRIHNYVRIILCRHMDASATDMRWELG